MHIIRPVAKQVEKLGIHDRHDKVKSIIRVRDNHKHGCPLIPQHIQFHLVIACQLPKLRYIKGGKPGPAGNKDGFCCLSRNELSRTFYQKNKQQYYLLHYACCVCHLAV